MRRRRIDLAGGLLGSDTQLVAPYLYEAQAPLPTHLGGGSDHSGVSDSSAPIPSTNGVLSRGHGADDASPGAISGAISPRYDCLALDLATSCGFDGPAGSGIANFDPGSRLELLDRHSRIFDMAGLWLAEAITLHKPHVLLLEGAGGFRGKGSKVLLGLRAIALMTARRREILVDTVTASEWQPWARRNLRWSKIDDEQDAIAMRAYWLAERQGAIEEA